MIKIFMKYGRLLNTILAFYNFLLKKQLPFPKHINENICHGILEVLKTNKNVPTHLQKERTDS